MASRRLMGFKRLPGRLLYVIRSVHSAHPINRHEHDASSAHGYTQQQALQQTGTVEFLLQLVAFHPVPGCEGVVHRRE